MTDGEGGGVMGPLRFDGGRVCLDLVGTRAGRPVVEGLPSAGRLREWVYGAGLVPDGAPVGVTEGWLAAFKELRARLDRMVGVELKAGAQAPEDVAALNEAARPAPPPPVAEISPGGGLRRGLHGAPSCAGLLAAVARDAVDLFTDPAACARLTRCAGRTAHWCTWTPPAASAAAGAAARCAATGSGWPATAAAPRPVPPGADSGPPGRITGPFPSRPGGQKPAGRVR